ncbi:twin-arginine translocase TatA/TatE family subunit [uncultured Slackia sp.]|uniref:twin-arginine translocase TatA/TatE family subunit n=1 Tax=uncultured Slackia sp. TaxID=665903 RepID=UPI0026E03E2D|nr:twin-arginine translocase TatA/TatE family subunit [uncultured Slackia sp.]
MFGIGGFELFLILLFGFLIFGPDKLPQLAKTIGMAVQKFRSAQDEMNKVVKTEIYDPMSDKPVKNPLDAIDKDNKQKVEKKESFASRKAKYDKEREDKKKREAANEAAKEVRAAAAAEKKASDEAAAAAGAAGAAVVAAAKTPTQVHEEVMSARKEATAKVAAQQEAKKAADKDLADEIFGTKPIVKKTENQDAAAPASDDAAEASDSAKKEDN